jgi:hypothetical protein
LKILFKSIKNKRFISLFVKIILFALVLLFFYFQLKKLDLKVFLDMKIENFSHLIFAVLFVSLNWYFEFLKWSVQLSFIQINSDLRTKWKSFLAGVLTGFLTPNLLGNFIGRLSYFEKRKRISIIYFTQFSNAAQFISSMVFGLISLLIIGFPSEFALENSILIQILIYLILFSLLLSYFNLHRIISKLLKKKKWFSSLLNRENFFYFEIKQFALSLLRHFVFSIQYLLIILAFGIEFKIELLFYVWQIYFWSTLIPSFWFGKLFIRESMAIWILGIYTNQSEIVLISSLILWIINQGIPALVGLPFLKLLNKK